MAGCSKRASAGRAGAGCIRRRRIELVVAAGPGRLGSRGIDGAFRVVGAYAAKVGAVEPPPPQGKRRGLWTRARRHRKGRHDLTIGERGRDTRRAKRSARRHDRQRRLRRHEVVPTWSAQSKAEGAMTGFMVLVSEGRTLRERCALERDARIVRRSERRAQQEVTAALELSGRRFVPIARRYLLAPAPIAQDIVRLFGTSRMSSMSSQTAVAALRTRLGSVLV